MRTFLLLLILSAQASMSAETKAQTQAPSCPSITIRDEEGYEVDRYVCIGKLTFTANVAGIIPTDKPTFEWKVSAGKIIGGQGTSRITVATGENLGEEITATVDVGDVSGISTQCDKRASTTVRVGECLCPTLNISCPTDSLKPGEPFTVSVSVAGGNPHVNPKYNWQVSAGKIIDGQGTPTITVDATRTDGQSITASVKVEGFRPECDKAGSCSFGMFSRPPLPFKFDEYGDVSSMDEQARLDNFNTQLKQKPGSKGYVIIYGPKRTAQHIARVRKFLVEKRGLNPDRIVLMNGGYNKKTKVELWSVPTGATPPKPNPNF